MANIDWPSRPGMTAHDQKLELLKILDRAVELHLNAVILQVRPACDAFYQSAYEPWSEFLTGEQGRSPGYDPLEYAVKEAHKRGLQLQAWFNPFRASHPSEHGKLAPSQIVNTHPQWIIHYDGMDWLDPGEPGARAYSLKVILDVVKRYDIDGIHLDDYFYPYPVQDKSGKDIPFPDDKEYNHYRNSGGSLDKYAWRRENIDSFIRDLYTRVKAIKPWVLVGISPFGIWRPGHPAQIKGFDSYNKIACDARLWLQKGWLDYLSPQLYWKIDQPAQSFPVLLDWWKKQNIKGRHIWPGLYSSKVRGGSGSWPPEEIINQIRLTRESSTSPGDVQFSMSALMDPLLGTPLLKELFQQQALVPSSPWLSHSAPGKPILKLIIHQSGIQLKWKEPEKKDRVWQWVVQLRRHGQWETLILPYPQHYLALPPIKEASIGLAVVSGVDRFGAQGESSYIRMPRANHKLN